MESPRDIVGYFTNASWSDALIRTTYLNLCERMSRMGDVNQAEELLKEAMAWVQSVKKRIRALRLS